MKNGNQFSRTQSAFNSHVGSSLTDWPLSALTCSVFEMLRSEARVMEGLRSLHIETLFIHDILKLNVQPSDSDYAWTSVTRPSV